VRAVVHDRYGPPEVLRVADVDRPEPAADEALVRVHATTVTRTDIHMRAAKPFFWRFMLGLRRPRRRILGLEFAGVVEAVGSGVSQFATGDRVFGLRNGSHAEYVCVREARLIAHIPDRLGFEETAAVCDGMSQGMNALRAGRVGPLRDLLEAGKYRAVVDRTYPLEDVVEATRYVESWQKTGNVVLTLSHDGEGAAR